MEIEKKGTALEYSESKGVPEIIAQARGQFVENLLQIARDHDITIYKDADLSEALSVLNIGSEVPEELYIAMTEVLAYCYEVNDRFKRKAAKIFAKRTF